MFEANNLIHFVFANDNDLYYCQSFLKMNLEKRLWWELQQAGFKNIYYLNTSAKDFLGGSEKDFEISTLGEPGAELPMTWLMGTTKSPNEKLFRQSMRKWMQSQSAAVCSLEQFCEVMDNEYRYRKTWDELLDLQQMHRGVLILTVSPQSEKLLESSRFLKFYHDSTSELQFLDVNSGMSIRERIRYSKDNNCVLWNVFSEKEIQYFLQHVILQDPEKISDLAAIKELSGYLAMVLDSEAVLGDDIFTGRTITRYQDLFPVLADRKNWRRLNLNAQRTSLLRFYDSYQVPEELVSAKVTVEGGKKITADIKASMEGLDLSECNTHIRAHISWLLLILRKKEREKDWGSCERVLYSVRFCMQWILTERGSDEEAAILNIIEQLYQYIRLSEDYFLEEKNLAMVKLGNEHAIAAKVRQQLVAKHSVSEQFLTRFEDLFLSSMLKLSMKHSEDSVRQIAEEIERWKDEMERNRADLMQNAEYPSGIPDEKIVVSEADTPEASDEEMYPIYENLYGIMPNIIK